MKHVSKEKRRRPARWIAAMIAAALAVSGAGLLMLSREPVESQELLIYRQGGYSAEINEEASLRQSFLCPVGNVHSLMLRTGKPSQQPEGGQAVFELRDAQNQCLARREIPLANITERGSVCLDFEPQRHSLGQMYTLIVTAQAVSPGEGFRMIMGNGSVGGRLEMPDGEALEGESLFMRLDYRQYRYFFSQIMPLFALAAVFIALLPLLPESRKRGRERCA